MKNSASIKNDSSTMVNLGPGTDQIKNLTIAILNTSIG